MFANHSMSKSGFSRSHRGGVLALTIVGVSLVSLGTVAVMTWNPAGTPGAGSGVGATVGGAAKAGKHLLQPGEVATVFHLVGIDPEVLASAGVTSLQCDDLFTTGSAVCLQTEYLTQLQLAHKNVNLATEKAVHPAAPGATDGQGNQLSVADCKTALSDLETAAFQAFTGSMDNAVKTKLASIRANNAQGWGAGVPAPYLTVNRTGEEWMALRGALVARRYSQQHGTQLAGSISELLATVEADTTVAQALSDLSGGLAGVRQSWTTHETANP